MRAKTLPRFRSMILIRFSVIEYVKSPRVATELVKLAGSLLCSRFNGVPSHEILCAHKCEEPIGKTARRSHVPGWKRIFARSSLERPNEMVSI
jgi:hypothetical protein